MEEWEEREGGGGGGCWDRVCAAVAVEEGRHLQLVAVAVRVEGRAEELVVVAQLGLLKLARVVAQLPDQHAVVAHRQLLHLAPQLQDLLALPAHQAAHHGQVRLGGVLQVPADGQLGALPWGRGGRAGESLVFETDFIDVSFYI
jgi:hypothetical protein